MIWKQTDIRFLIISSWLLLMDYFFFVAKSQKEMKTFLTSVELTMPVH